MAVKLLTPLTEVEHQLCIEWVAKGMVNPSQIKSVFPQLYYYLQPFSLNSDNPEVKWIFDYFDAYRYSKIADRINDNARKLLAKKNSNSVSFQGWKDNFKTVKTVLHGRSDIDVFYWIDGLGVDWIPFIRNIVARYSKEHVYLNEIFVATSDIPTTTSVNKEKLQSILPEGESLQKIGDLDNFAHSNKKYPQYIIDEMQIVEKAICKVLDEYNGKKIAFISDHGISYLSQYEDGMKIGGVEANHEGRLATYTGTLVEDDKYIKLEDGKTICSLTYQSIVDKVNKGHGAHGGCTPEEVLVPIIIVSSQENSNNYSALLVNDEIDNTNSFVSFKIKGLSSVDVPTVLYNGVIYKLNKKGNDEFVSERLILVETATKVQLFINGSLYDTYPIKVSIGAIENELFGDLPDF